MRFAPGRRRPSKTAPASPLTGIPAAARRALAAAALAAGAGAFAFVAFAFVAAAPAAAVETLGDTLTVIQRPLLNIPAFVVPGGELTISCEAAAGATGWAAELRRGARVVPLAVTAAVYEASTLWWRLTAAVPAGVLSELYDLRVTAAGGIDDVTRHAVRVLPAYRGSYYFVQITDPHLPTNLYYTDPASAADSSEVLDLRAVIDDVNLINPEFVVITGDLIHEGELEEFLDRRYYSRAQRVLGEFAVPVFLLSGNHDIGGWDDTPPSDGTARRDWWRFFGWKRLADPPAGAPARTQDYSFDYGSVHYVGLEAYLNYDGWLPQYYGAQSFTAAQLQWLSADLAAAAGSSAQVLFYHYDFSGQLDLAGLGVEMALSGHIHRDSGSLTTQPYDLVTNNTGGGERAYRVVHVNNGVVTPHATVSAGPSGENVRVTFSPANDGSYDTVSATVANGLPIRFENALLKFVMPHHPGAGYLVTGGTFLQADQAGPTDVCYVSVDLLANSTASVSVTVDLTAIPPRPVDGAALVQSRPNPFNPRTTFTCRVPQAGRVRLTIHDARGAAAATLLDADLAAGDHSVAWDGLDDRGAALPSGVYLARLETAAGVSTTKVTLAR